MCWHYPPRSLYIHIWLHRLIMLFRNNNFVCFIMRFIYPMTVNILVGSDVPLCVCMTDFFSCRLHDKGGGEIYLAFNAHDFFVKVSIPPAPPKRRWFRVVSLKLPDSVHLALFSDLWFHQYTFTGNEDFISIINCNFPYYKSYKACLGISMLWLLI